MPSLSETLPEPANGTTVVLFRDDGEALVASRDDSRSPETAALYGARWYAATGFEGEEPRSWDYITAPAVRAYALGELLADTEAEPAENAADDEEDEHHDQWCDCSDCAERGRNALRRAKREAGR